MPKRDRDLAALAAFAFSPEEGRRLANLPDDLRAAEFHRLWSLKEARGKQVGEGLMPRRSRLVTAWPAGPGQAHAATWDVGAGTLSVVCDGVSGTVVEGLPVPVAPAWWRFETSATTGTGAEAATE